MGPDGRRIIDETIYSQSLLKRMRVRVALPPGYDPAAGPYPVAFLLHPWGDDETYWTDAVCVHEAADHLIEAGALPPFVAVMPQGDKSFFVNAADPGGDFSLVLRLDPEHFEGALEGYGDYGDYLLQDVLSMVERAYHVRTDRAGRVIAGIAMGATGAAVLAFAHPEVFGTVGIHSPVLFTEYHLGPPWIFGLGDPLALAQRDPIQLAHTLDPRDGLRIYLDCGQDDDMWASTERLHEALVRRGVRHTYVSRQGGHTTDYWRAHLAKYLGFYAAGW
jgi:enterochelin esterase-like enzyme